MKKIVFAFIFAFIFTFSPVIAIAASDISSMPIHEQIKIIGEHCYCGREFYTEDENGTIELGKNADLVVCEKNIYDIAHDEIKTTKIDMTILAGRTVFERN